MGLFSSVESWVSFLTLTVLEIVLGIDNLIFISVATEHLPLSQQLPARQLGLLFACLSRLLLLVIVACLARFNQPLFNLLKHDFSGRDLFLIAGGLFLLAKSSKELWYGLMGGNSPPTKPQHVNSWFVVVLQITALDLVFSLDSVITAIGLTKEWGVIAWAIVVSVGVMLWAGEFLSRVIRVYPTLRTLGLSFLLLIGFMLILEGLSLEIPRAYAYSAIAFSTFVEWVNIKTIRLRRP